jgi:hypothetical protein
MAASTGIRVTVLDGANLTNAHNWLSKFEFNGCESADDLNDRIGRNFPVGINKVQPDNDNLIVAICFFV